MQRLCLCMTATFEKPCDLRLFKSRARLDLAVLAFNRSRFLGTSIVCRTRCSIATCRSGLAVDFLADALHRALQVISRELDARHIVLGESITYCPDLLLELRAQTGRDLVGNVPERSLGLIGYAIGAVTHLYLFLALAVFLGMQFSFTHHALHLALGKTAGGRDGNLLLAPGRLIACGDIENAIGIDVEGHLDLWYAAWSRSNAFETEVTQALVVTSQFTFAL